MMDSTTPGRRYRRLLERHARLVTRRLALAQSGGTRGCRHRRGQTLIIFALSFTVLVALAGLALDSARAVDLFGRMQRAADAGALAGVLYMPTYFNTVRPGDTESAVSRAAEEVIKNGFGSPIAPTSTSTCPTPASSVEVAICQVTGKHDELEVAITEQLDLVLLQELGVTPITLTATSAAEYLPVVQLGSRLNYFGDQVECSTQNPPDPTQAGPCGTNQGGIFSGGNHLQYFIATVKGPADLKEQGDPYVACEEGPSVPQSAADLTTGGNIYTPYNYTFPWSNHIQYTDAISNHCGMPGVGGKAGNPDQQPAGFDGPATDGTAHPGGYNYVVVVPPGITDAELWIYNPSFIPQDNLNVNGQTNGFDNFAGYPKPQSGTGGGVNQFDSNFDSPALYFTTTYSLYSTVSPYDRASDTLLKSVNYPAYDGFSFDKNLHGCTGASTVYDPFWQDYLSGGTYKQQGALETVNSYNQPSRITAGGGCLDLASGLAPSWNPTAPAACFMQWCPFAQHLGPGTYRFVVEDTGYTTNVPANAGQNTIGYTSTGMDGTGSKSYALKICPTSGAANPYGCPNGASGGNPGVSVYGWNNMEVAFSAPVGQQTPDPNNPATSCVTSNATPYTCVDLGCIPTAYAGRSVSISLFDPADEGASLEIAVTPPPGSGATVTYPSFVPAATRNGVKVVPGDPFNGLWLYATASLPPTYTGNCLTGPGGTGWWQLLYASGAGVSPNDWLAVRFTLVGSPIHLVPPIVLG